MGAARPFEAHPANCTRKNYPETPSGSFSRIYVAICSWITKKTRTLTEYWVTNLLSAMELWTMVGLQFEKNRGAIINQRFILGAKRKENSCYCTDKCMPSGVINASLCRHGLPAMLSLPHFYFADPVYLEPVEGLKPNRSKHESYLIIEPVIIIFLHETNRDIDLAKIESRHGGNCHETLQL